MRDFLKARINEKEALLAAMTEDDKLAAAIEKTAGAMTTTLREGGTIFLFGNGGSAADAQHIAAELVGRFQDEREALASEALTVNASSLTAIANDYGYEKVFERQVAARARQGDLVIGISTSGGSPNVIKGLEEARRRGCVTVALTGGRDHPPIAEAADILLAVPSTTTARIQEIHIFIGHILCAYLDQESGWRRS